MNNQDFQEHAIENITRYKESINRVSKPFISDIEKFNQIVDE